MLARIVAYSMVITVFFVFMEIFTVFYSQIPEHMQPFRYLFVGLERHHRLVPWMWAAVLLAGVALVLLLNPRTRQNEGLLALACAAVFISLWIEKGLGLVVTGFIPSPLEKITEYSPTRPEVLITLGIWAVGFLVLTFLYKVALSVREEMEG
jgi:molybdopterin-containing oxidoreductase family membrane subunit